ncbi:MAG: leucine-rich repeat protein [Kiritimatiellae bacterium]|nr:leucine-rich repeat protein [Kiritimatiellia bacterium]
MKKSLIKFVTVTIFAFTVTSANALTETVNGITWTYTVSNGEASLGSGNSYDGAVPTSKTGAISIPVTLGGFPVTSIGAYAFYYCSGLTDVVIPDSITNIGAYAFFNCSGLADIVIPDTVTRIERSVFCGCSCLTNVTLPNSITNIGDFAFGACSSLQNITIPDSVIKIGDNAFKACSGLMSVTIGDSVIHIGEYAFQNCISLKELTLPNTLESIAFKAFDGCDSLEAIYGDQAEMLRLMKLLLAAGAPVVLPSDGIWTETIDGTNWTYKLTDCVASIGGGRATGLNYYPAVDRSTTGSLVVPSYVYGYCPVREIGEWAFRSCRQIESVTIPEGVARIGNSAFEECYNLRSIILPESLRDIDDFALYSCRKLTSVNIPAAVTNIGEKAFGYSDSLTEITIPANVTSIGDHAFEGCAKLERIDVVPDNPCYTSIDGVLYDKHCTRLIWCPGMKTTVIIPASVTNIPYYAFFENGYGSNEKLTEIEVEDGNPIYATLDGVLYDKAYTKLLCCPSQKESIEIPSSVTSIGRSAFYGCKKMIEVELPSGVTEIGIQAFSHCFKLQSIQIPNGVTSIEGGAFYDCFALSGISLPPSVTNIGPAAFDGCSEIPAITIPYAVTNISSDAFQWCHKLTAVTIPDRVANIGDNAFAFCSGLTNLVFEGNAPAVSTTAFSEVCEGCTAYVKRGSTGWDVDIPGMWNGINIAYIDGEETPEPIWTIENGVLTAVDLNGCTEVTIPGGVTNIGNSTFYGCSGLTSVTMPDCVTSIGRNAFYGCSGLTSMTIPNSVTSIGEGAFSGCSGLTSVTIPEGVTEIGNAAFGGCRGLTSVTIPDSVTSIGDRAFINCSGLTSVTMPNSITNVGDYAFYRCGQLSGEIKIPDGVLVVGEYAFSQCSNITSVIISDTVTNIGYGAFSKCVGMKELSFGRGVQRAPEAFAGCTSLKELILPEGLKCPRPEMYAYNYWAFAGAFRDCTGLEKVVIPSTFEYGLSDSMFSGCVSLKDVTIREGVKTVGATVFGGCRALSRIVLPASLSFVDIAAFVYCGENGFEVVYADGTKSLTSDSFFQNQSVTKASIPATVTEIGSGTFYACSNLAEIVFSGIPETLNFETPYSGWKGHTIPFWTQVRVQGSADNVRLRLDRATEDITWSADVINMIVGEYIVKSNATLTIEDGAVVKFAKNASLVVEAGGTCIANGVTFTHIADDEAGGDSLLDGSTTEPSYGEYAVTGSMTTNASTVFKYYTDSTISPWGDDPIIGDEDTALLPPNWLVNVSLSVFGEAAPVGSCVAGYDSEGVLRAYGVVENNGKLDICVSAFEGTKIYWQAWVFGTPQDAVLDAVGSYVTQKPGEDYSGVSITVLDTVSQVITVERSGWNLISFNALPDDPSPEAVFGDVADKIQSVVSGTKRWTPQNGGRLTELKIGVGYWVKTTEDNVSWTVTGRPDEEVEITLNAGWNLIGYPLLESGDPGTVLKSAADAGIVSSVVSGTKRWTPQSGGRLTEMSPGVGYWLKANEAATITFDK